MVVFVDESLNSLQVRIVPNPTTGILSITLSKQIEGVSCL